MALKSSDLVKQMLAAAKEEVEEIAAGVEGVTDVNNELTVAVLTSV